MIPPTAPFPVTWLLVPPHPVLVLLSRQIQDVSSPSEPSATRYQLCSATPLLVLRIRVQPVGVHIESEVLSPSTATWAIIKWPAATGIGDFRLSSLAPGSPLWLTVVSPSTIASVKVVEAWKPELPPSAVRMNPTPTWCGSGRNSSNQKVPRLSVVTA